VTSIKLIATSFSGGTEENERELSGREPVILTQDLPNTSGSTESFFNFVDRFRGPELEGNRGDACREAHMNFADKAVCLMADSVWNEGSN
jgi:hypothetical protein